jgi:hypothetical protein
VNPQEAAVEQYRKGERGLRTMARWAVQAGDTEGARDYLRLAHMVGVAYVREHRGAKPDEWERQYPLGRTA